MSNHVAVMIDCFGSRSMLRAYGDLDTSTASNLEVALEAIAAGPATDVFLDLTGVSFFDARAIGVFAGASAELRRRGGRLRVHGLTSLQERMLHIVGLDAILLSPVHRPRVTMRCRNEAVAAIGRPKSDQAEGDRDS